MASGAPGIALEALAPPFATSPDQGRRIRETYAFLDAA
jgi:hypothetical protein